jgi:hypothetical protein
VTTRTDEKAKAADQAVSAREPGEALVHPQLAPFGHVLALQRAVGNRAVGRILARLQASWSTQASAQATAAATRTRLQTALISFMQNHSRRIVRNTAELFTGTSPLLTLDAITKRSDSSVQVASPTAPAWVTPGRDAAFFRGATMTNVHYHDKDMIGTLDGTTMYVRGHTDSGTLEPLEDMANTVVHECSHFFVSQYGELPQTNVAASFHRYADEFRAYWVEGQWGNLPAAERAARIRQHLVGTQGDPSSGYGALRTAYWAAGPNPFRTQVDALTGPLGFNLTNSIRLHRLWQLFRDQAAGTATVDDLVFAIARLPPAERAEAARSTLIRGFETAIGGPGARRVRAALSAPTSDEYVGQVNPSRSPAINLFLGAIIVGNPEVLKREYANLSREDRRTLTRNPAFMVFVDHHLLDSAMRAAVWAMTETWSTSQFDAMTTFIDALRRARTEASGGALTGVPDYVTQALAGLHDYSRWTMFSWSREGAMREYVDVLPRPIANEIRERLRA